MDKAEEKKVKLNVYITPYQKKELEKLNQKTGAPIAEIVRRFIEDGLKTKKTER
jgi:hypothetical protein